LQYVYKHYHRRITDEELIADLKTAAEKLRKTSITANEYTKLGRYHDCTLKARFGSWTKAVKLAGLTPLRKERVSKGDLIYDLKQAAQKAGKDSLTTTEYESLGSYSRRKYISVWGTWNDSLKAAGLRPAKTGKRTEDELMANLKRVWDLLAKQPSAKDMEKHSRISVTTYRNRYGSWQNALKEFVKNAMSNDECQMSNKKAGKSDSPKQKSGTAEKHRNANVKNKNVSSAGTDGIFEHKTSRSISVHLRYKVLLRDSFRCVLCGRSPAMEIGCVLQVDHIKPWSLGGETEIDNLRSLCRECNLGKGGYE
jgi:5-methylcytosine-specific restriction endonuclease McrA